MNARKLFARAVEWLFPGYVAQIKNRISAKRTAMQTMLDASHALKMKGCEPGYADVVLRKSLEEYSAGNYELAERAARNSFRY